MYKSQTFLSDFSYPHRPQCLGSVHKLSVIFCIIIKKFSYFDGQNFRQQVLFCFWLSFPLLLFLLLSSNSWTSTAASKTL